MEKVTAVADRALRTAEKLNVDEAEAYVASNRVFTVRLASNTVSEVNCLHDVGVGVRVAMGKGLGFASTTTLTEAGIEEAVSSAIKAAQRVKFPFRMTFPKPAKPPSVSGIYDKRLSELGSSEAAELAYEMIRTSLAYDRRIIDNAGIFKIADYTISIKNTRGLSVSDHGTTFGMFFVAIAKEGGKTVEGRDSIGGRSLKEVKPEEVGKNAAEMAVGGLKVTPLKSDAYDVILWFGPTSDFVNILSSAVSPIRHSSLFANKVGKEVASEKVSFYDDQNKPGGFGSCSIDDEGNPAKRITIIEKGVFKTFIYDTLDAKLGGKEVTGGACREPLKLPMIPGTSFLIGKTYARAPESAALNPTLEAGQCTTEEIVKETKNGLLVKQFHYGSLDPHGVYAAYLKSGLYKIEKGEVVGAIAESQMVESFLDILKNVNMVSKEQSAIVGMTGGSTSRVLRSKAHVMPVA